MPAENKTELFESMPVPKAVRIMAVPTVMAQLIVLIYNMADTFFLGQANDPDMVAAASLILPVFNIALSLSGLTGVGGGALISRLLGRHEEEEAARVSFFSIGFSVLCAVCFSLFTLFLIRPLLTALGADGDVFLFAKEYALCVIVFGGIPTVLSNTLSALLRSVGESRRAGFGIMMGGVINIGLDPLFMFVLLPRGKEILGAGAATCLSNIISCVYFILVIRRMKENPVFRFRRGMKLPKRKNIGNIFSVGVPSSITTLLFDLDYVILDRLMSAYGTLALAAVGIVLKVERLPLNVGVGICQGMMPIIAYNYSSGNLERMRKTKRFSLTVGLVFAGLSLLFYEVSAGGIIRFFIRDPETVRLGTTFLRIRSLATPLMFLSFFHVFLFNGFGRGDKALFLGVSRWVVFNIPMLFLLNRLIGMYGLVWSQVTADILTVILSLIVYAKFEKS